MYSDLYWSVAFFNNMSRYNFSNLDTEEFVENNFLGEELVENKNVINNIKQKSKIII